MALEWDEAERCACALERDYGDVGGVERAQECRRSIEDYRSRVAEWRTAVSASADGERVRRTP